MPLPNMSARLIAPIEAPGMFGQLEHRHAAAACGDLDLDLLVVEFAGAQLAPEASRVAGAALLPTSASSTRSSAARSALASTCLRLLLLDQADADLDEVAHDLLDVAADIADFGELGRLDLEEGRAREPGEPARDLGLAAAGRPDHQDVWPSESRNADRRGERQLDHRGRIDRGVRRLGSSAGPPRARRRTCIWAGPTPRFSGEGR